MIELLILALATYGTSKLVAEYDGFADVLYKIRSKSYLKALTCSVCASVWFGVLFSIIFWLGFVWLMLPLALVGVVILIEEVTS